ncbi:MAG: transglycosylase SLT domain-containing protein [Burkholderiales bacterium]
MSASIALLLALTQATAAPSLTLDQLPRYTPPPAERGPVLPAQVERWREEAKAYEHGDAGIAANPQRAAQLYCRAARFGDAESQFNLGWMLTNSRGIQRDEAQAAHLFAAAAEQGMQQAVNMAKTLGEPLGAPPPCLRPPDGEEPPAPPVQMVKKDAKPAKPFELPWPPPPSHAPEPIVRYVQLVAPEFQLAPALVLAVIAQESNFNPNAVSPKNAQGLMQLIPDTARRFGVRNIMDPTQNIRGGMAYLRWLLAYFQGDVRLALAAYNAGEGAVNRYRGVPPYAETQHYVRKIIANLGGRSQHPFDDKITNASPVMALVRGPGRWQ